MHPRWLVAFAFALVSACSTMTMRISRGELQADLAKRFPREADKHVVTIRASDPRIDFPGAPDVVGVRLRLDATTASGNSHLSGTTRVEGRIEYVAAEHAFYLRDPRVTALELAAPDGDGALARLVDKAHHTIGTSLIERAASAAVEELLRHNPIYRLDAKRSAKEAKAIRHLRRVRIDGDDLVLEVAL